MSVATVVAGRNFDRSAPILLTATNEEYDNFFVRWASKAGASVVLSSCSLPILRSRTGPHTAATPNVKGFHEKWAINIGLMMFGLGSEKLLLRFLTTWWQKRSEAFDVAAEQMQFQRLVGRFATNDSVEMELLDEKFLQRWAWVSVALPIMMYLAILSCSLR